MAVIAFRELARENTYKFGEPRRLKRRFVCTLDTPDTPAPAISAALGIDLGSPHPDYEGDRCVEIQLNEQYENSRFHVETVYTYGMPDGGAGATAANPLDRPPVWTFQTQGASVPALYYWQGNELKPLTNSAFDYYQGLTVDEAQTKVLIKRNLPKSDASTLYALTGMTNTINAGGYLGGGENTWKCQGVGGELLHETVNGVEVGYWAVTVELLFRESGWNLRLPDVGFNFIGGGQKRRAMVFDFENSEWVPSPGPVGLNGGGAQTVGAPAILDRRVYRQSDFNAAFGSPPT